MHMVYVVGSATITSKLAKRALSQHPVDVGLRSEAVITAELVRRGVTVLQPMGFNHRYDLVLDIDGEFVRAQCKTGRLRDGCIVFNSESVRCNTKAAVRRGYDGQADIFLVYCPDVEEIYAVPVGDAPLSHMGLRVKPTANSQAKGIRWAADYALPA